MPITFVTQNRIPYSRHQTLILFCLCLSILVLFVNGVFANQAYGEEKIVRIPFGAFNPELNTPVEVWYDPPAISVNVGDTITWVNNDREGHTVTSGEGAGRFGWMGNQQFGEPDGFFDSDRFLPGESWSNTFDDVGTFSYFCRIHPWMEGIIKVESIIPDYPHDASGKKIERFPILQITPDRSVEVNFSWDPKVIKTNEKVNFIYRFYDAVNDLPLLKLEYDIMIIHNGKEVFRDENAISGAGGDYRQWVFEEPGQVIIKFRNIESAGAVGDMAITLSEDPTGRLADFTAIVYENPEELTEKQIPIQPSKTFQFYYEIAVLIIVIPAILLGLILLLSRHKPKVSPEIKKSTPI